MLWWPICQSFRVQVFDSECCLQPGSNHGMFMVAVYHHIYVACTCTCMCPGFPCASCDSSAQCCLQCLKSSSTRHAPACALLSTVVWFVAAHVCAANDSKHTACIIAMVRHSAARGLCRVEHLFEGRIEWLQAQNRLHLPRAVLVALHSGLEYGFCACCGHDRDICACCGHERDMCMR